MVADENGVGGDVVGNGSNGVGGGGDDETNATAAAERVVMIAFKMEDVNDDAETMAGPSSLVQRQSDDVGLEQMVSPPFSDENPGKKSYVAR